MLLDSSGGNVFPDNFDNVFAPGQRDRFRQQMEFILEVDKLKNVLRKTILMDRSRRENSAEHSWHIALTVLILSEYAKDSEVDFFRVMKILLVHDLIEIDAGEGKILRRVDLREVEDPAPIDLETDPTVSP